MKKLKRWAKVFGECLFAFLLPLAYESWSMRKRIIQEVIDMPHGTTHCDIIQALKNQSTKGGNY